MDTIKINGIDMDINDLNEYWQARHNNLKLAYENEKTKNKNLYKKLNIVYQQGYDDGFSDGTIF